MPKEVGSHGRKRGAEISRSICQNDSSVLPMQLETDYISPGERVQ